MAAVPPAIPKADELYNSLMREIEPELTTDQIPLLMEKYKDETQEQREARMARYNAAFEAYEKALETHVSGLQKDVGVFRKQVLGE
ncbi:MAG: hypothetical protein PHE68_06160, partial [Candidatus Peribacteraceae bacterium]|nr:hypothetical protein [Candidatus Peribacteraceae bacterium]